ncbi:MAG: tRNA (adenosine(37)-N6)-threonylcarbamoyltransferase complex transferase subunit TsaD [Defluviitaleaceae bacterium]|nr:tRNA (adenosine(37)-N6)-threonylcarbamoyltransferase complex transferase subunit TsaD [Defluviitaleaceae bacterium]
MIILGIETSCDETSAAVVADGRRVLSNIIASQVDLHAPFGGVVPELAARRHIESIGFIVDEALAKAGITLADIDAYAVANGPGLAGALLVGLNYAKGLAFVHKKPLIGVHHIEGHVCANFLDADAGASPPHPHEGGNAPLNPGCMGEQLAERATGPEMKNRVSHDFSEGLGAARSREAGQALKPPFLSLVVSGGHTLLLSVEDYDTYRVVGSTRDDAAGEAFDKIARVLGLPYPGGPEIDKISRDVTPTIHFPRAKVSGFDFSFSGLKTAVVQYVRKQESADVANIAASFQEAVVDVLAKNAVAAAKAENFDTIALAGGVACNSALRKKMRDVCDAENIRLCIPAPVFCTDNAAMIASRGYFALRSGKRDGLDLNAFPGRMV